MRNFVSKVFVGTGVANVKTLEVGLDALADKQIIAYDADTGLGLVAGSTNIKFAMGTAVLGEPVISPAIPKAAITAFNSNAYQAAVKKKMTLTVTAVPTAGKSPIHKIVYHDNLSIIPNQIKQTAISVEAESGDTTTTYAAKIAAEFNKQADGGQLFVAVTTATNVVTFESLVLSSQSAYNHIDRPEVVNFEISDAGYDDASLGAYTIATTVALKPGQGDAAKIAWLEENAQGRRGYNDRRLWNNAAHQYVPNAVAGIEYVTYVIEANDVKEGDMQDTRSNPIGIVFCTSAATGALVLVDLATAGVVPTVVPVP